MGSREIQNALTATSPEVKKGSAWMIASLSKARAKPPRAAPAVKPRLRAEYM